MRKKTYYNVEYLMFNVLFSNLKVKSKCSNLKA